MLSEVKRVFILVVILPPLIRVAVIVVRLSPMASSRCGMVLFTIQPSSAKSFIDYFRDTQTRLIHHSLLRVVFSPGLLVLLNLVCK